MKAKLLVIFTIALSATGLKAQFTNTLSFDGAAWNDDATLSGYFTVGFDATGTPVDLVSLDVITGDGIFPGYEYIYSVSGQADTAQLTYATPFDATEGGFPANEVSVESLDGNRILNLDWQGTSPTSLYIGDPAGLHSSEVSFAPAYQIRDLSTDGGLGGTVASTPEPGTFALIGLAGASLIIYRRRNSH